jgi:hypothetical protein
MNEFCTQCSTAFRPGDQFCGKCGAPRPQGVVMGSPPQGVIAPQPVGSAAAPKKGVPILSLAMGLLMPLGIGAFLFFGLGDCSGETAGSMRVSGARGNFNFTPVGCVNTQPYEGRMGANLHGEGNNDGAVYVLGGINGSEVRIEVPGSCQNSDGTDCTVFPIPRDRCATYEARVTPTSTTVNDVRVVEGHVRLQCTLEDGTEVRGSITFSGCGAG